VGLRGRLKRLERAAEEEMIVIPQRDGTVKRFAQSEGMEALVSLIDGEDHPLAEAARNSSEPKWANSFYSAFPIDDAEDLSEQP
jgi:2-phospho-L-lactate guanylyltransferase (CobY/MobA/RfbA family)